MKVLLIEPPKTCWELMGGKNVSPPLGLAQIAGMLEEKNIDVEIIDCNASELNWHDLENKIEKTQPSVVGSTAITPSFYKALEVMKIAKKVDEKIFTVLGGPHPTFTVEETFQNPEVNAVVKGEGEIAFLELIRCLEENKKLSDVKGLAYQKDNEVVQTPPQPPADVDTLPLPAYHLLPMEKYHFIVFDKFVTILSSRGCTHRCTFCSEWKFWGAHWRARDPVKVVDEMEILNKKYGRNCFWFGDDCFNVNKKHIHEICTELMERDLNISWFYQGRADFLIKYKDLLPEMRESGNLMAQIGVETSKNEEMKAFHKGLAVEQVKKAVDLLKKNDIVSQGLVLIGSRKDDADSILHKIKYMKWLDVDFPIFTVYTPFPGSNIYEEAKANNWLEVQDYSKYDMAHAIIPTEHLSRGQVASLYYYCFKSCYLDPIKLAKGLLSRNEWKRKIWRHMTKFTLNQITASFRKLRKQR